MKYVFFVCFKEALFSKQTQKMMKIKFAPLVRVLTQERCQVINIRSNSEALFLNSEVIQTLATQALNCKTTLLFMVKKDKTTTKQTKQKYHSTHNHATDFSG